MEEKSPAVEESSHGVDESSHGDLFLRPRRTAENGCYVKKFTNDVSFFTYYVRFFT